MSSILCDCELHRTSLFSGALFLKKDLKKNNNNSILGTIGSACEKVHELMAKRQFSNSSSAAADLLT